MGNLNVPGATTPSSVVPDRLNQYNHDEKDTEWDAKLKTAFEEIKVVIEQMDLEKCGPMATKGIAGAYQRQPRPYKRRGKPFSNEIDTGDGDNNF